MRRKSLGAEHISTFSAMYDLASTYIQLGQWTKTAFECANCENTQKCVKDEASRHAEQHGQFSIDIFRSKTMEKNGKIECPNYGNIQKCARKTILRHVKQHKKFIFQSKKNGKKTENLNVKVIGVR